MKKLMLLALLAVLVGGCAAKQPQPSTGELLAQINQACAVSAAKFSEEGRAKYGITDKEEDAEARRILAAHSEGLFNDCRRIFLNAVLTQQSINAAQAEAAQAYATGAIAQAFQNLSQTYSLMATQPPPSLGITNCSWTQFGMRCHSW